MELLALVFERLPKGDETAISLDQLNETQLHVLRSLADTPLVWKFANMSLELDTYGLPRDQNALRDFLRAGRC